MKRIIIALMVAVTFCSLAMAQNPTINPRQQELFRLHHRDRIH